MKHDMTYMMKTKGHRFTDATQQHPTRNHRTHTLLRTAALVALLLTSVGMRAADYVLTYTNGGTTYYLARNGTTGVQRVTTFDPATCIWSCASDAAGTTAGTLNNSNTYGYLYQTVNGTRYFLNASANALGLGTNANTNYYRWRTNGTYVYNRYNNNTSYYINLASGVARNTTANTASNAKPYEVTISDIVQGLSEFEITGGASSFNAEGSSTYGHTNSTYCDQAYTHYNFNGNNYYVNASNVSTGTNPATAVTDAANYTWSLSDDAAGYATVDNNGVVTVTAIPTSGKITITLTCTVTYNSQTATATKSITLTQTGVSGTTVTLDDREDHNWSYYQSSANLPTGYPTDYLSSPDPRNVKITYRGGSVSGASAVAISALDGEGQNTMVYYKTLEKSVPGMTGDYPYTVISNPFSKRPRTTGSTGTNGFYGFAGWKVISGGEYISEYADNATLPLDATIHFTNLNTNYTPNCTSAEVIFEATWTAATVKTGNSAQTFTGGTYETNFWVLTANPTGAVTVPANCTMTARYPDGTSSWNGDFTRAITAGGNNAKVEWVNMNSTGNVTAANHTFTMGRGIVNSGDGGQLSGCNTDANCNQTVKIESGTYNTLYNFTVGLNTARSCDQLMILGSDYDRAKGDNTKLTIRGNMFIGTGIQLNRAANALYTRTYIKSGHLGSTVTVSGNTGYTGAGGSNTYYYSVSNTHNAGRRYLCMEGGRIDGIAGGMDETNNQTVTARAFDLRVRGTAQIDGVVYGAAEYANARGIRTMIFTGGTVNGWVAGGANGTQSTNGALTGATYLYVGGSTRVDSNNSSQVLNRAIGGNVFGAGCGYSATSSSGRILTYNTNVVVADESYVERGVYGGGSYGYTTNTSNIYILGGTVDGKDGGVNGTAYLATIDGGVYGGACQNQGGTVNITMNGGTVNGSVYGGSNYTGTLSGTSTVTLNGGTINGSLYGGGNGEGSANTNVNGAVQVTVNGGTVTDAVYGCNNNNGAPQSSVKVDIYGTDPAPSANQYALGAVFGGGNHANYSGTPQVTVHNCDNSIEYVYGGGNAAAVAATDVTIWGGNVIGNVFGGGNGTVTAANVSGNTNVKIYGGTILKVFGGSNSQGTIGGTINVTAESQPETAGDTPCPMRVDELYGGGNMAPSNVGNITIGCMNGGDMINYVYGGSNDADITGAITLTMTGGRVEHLFGGNNTGHSISGDIEVNVDWGTSCPNSYLGYVYGAGNKADFGHNTTVNIKNGTVTHDVFGGGLEAEVAGDVAVNVTGGAVLGDLYGGGALANTNTGSNKTTTVNLVGGSVNNVYGGGLGQKDGFYGATSDIPAYVNGNVLVELNGSTESGATNNCVVTGSIFGCNNLNGTPKGTVTVHVHKTKGNGTTKVRTASDKLDSPTESDHTYELAAVYGGGNMAAYEPTDLTNGKTVVIIDGCDETSIGYVYGGGNAASVPATEVTINGTYEIGNVFGGGNGKDALPNGDPNPGANVGYYADGTTAYGTGVATVNAYGGLMHSVFGGSNTLGDVRQTSVAYIDELSSCPLQVDEIYGGGNEAYMSGNLQVKLGCITYMKELYGGAKAAPVGGDIVLTITSGHFDRIFGGNNISGNIGGSITINIEETGCHPVTIGELYGCGNNAAYTTPAGKSQPTINIKSFTSIGRVFGGGLGTGAVVTGNPTIHINEVIGERASYSPWTYPGSTITYSDGSTVTLPAHTAGEMGSIGTVFGGGNAADVVGDTYVNVATASTVDYVSVVEGESTARTGIAVVGANIAGNVYGGGNEADVTGKTNVTIGPETTTTP